MIDNPISFGKFIVAWLPALAVTATSDPTTRVGDMFVVDLHGLPVPVITCLLGLLGIVLSRPFARRTESELSLPLKLLVSAIMLVVVELWIIETRPGWLYAFVIAIGLGFAGYSLLELFGAQIRQTISDAFDKARTGIGSPPGDQP